jgi:hypothetical protein
LFEGSCGGKEQDILETESGFGDPWPKEKSMKNESDKDFYMSGMSRRKFPSSVKNEVHTSSEVHKMNIAPWIGAGE